MPRSNPRYTADTKLNKRGRPKFSFAAVKRTIRMIMKFYPALFPLICFCSVFSSAVSAIPSIFTQRIIGIIGEQASGGEQVGERRALDGDGLGGRVADVRECRIAADRHRHPRLQIAALIRAQGLLLPISHTPGRYKKPPAIGMIRAV